MNGYCRSPTNIHPWTILWMMWNQSSHGTKGFYLFPDMRTAELSSHVPMYNIRPTLSTNQIKRRCATCLYEERHGQTGLQISKQHSYFYWIWRHKRWRHLRNVLGDGGKRWRYVISTTRVLYRVKACENLLRIYFKPLLKKKHMSKVYRHLYLTNCTKIWARAERAQGFTKAVGSLWSWAYLVSSNCHESLFSLK